MFNRVLQEWIIVSAPRPRGSRSLAFIVLFSPLLLIYNRLFSGSECFLSLNYSPVFCAQTVINWSCWCFAIVPGVLMRLFLFRGFYGGNSCVTCNECEDVAKKITQINCNTTTTKSFTEFKCSMFSALTLLRAD